MYTCLFIFNFTIFENHKSRDTLNVVSACYFRILININLHKLDSFLKFSCYLF